MKNKDPRVDAYIEKSAAFAKPILKHIRKLVHTACPNVEETIKWSFPNFDYKGSILCSMAAFKAHCSFGFWKASLMEDPEKLFAAGIEGMGHLGKISSLDDLPVDEILLAYIREAAILNEEGVKLPPKLKAPKNKELLIPDYMEKALKKNKKAYSCFTSLSYSHKHEYLEWITEAKTEATRLRRLETAVEWLAEGKSRNWKYERK